MDTLTAEKLEYLLSGYKVSMEDRDGIIDLMEGYAKQEVERAKVFSSNAMLAVSLPTTCQFLNRSGVFEKCPNVNVCELCRQ